MPDIDPSCFDGVGQPFEKYRARDVMNDIRGLQSTASGYRNSATNHEDRARELRSHATMFDLKAQALANQFLAPLEGATDEQIAYLEHLEAETDRLRPLEKLTDEQLEGLATVGEFGEFITSLVQEQ